MSTIADILLAQGQQAAQTRRSKVSPWASIVPQLANLPNALAADKAQQAQNQYQQRAQAQQLELGDQRVAAGRAEVSGRDAAAEKAARLTELLSAEGIIGADGLFDLPTAQAAAQAKGYTDLIPDLMQFDQEWDKAAADQALKAAQTRSADRANLPTGPKTREVKTRNADGSESIRIVEDVPGQDFTSAPEAAKPDTRSLQLQAADAFRAGDIPEYKRIMRVISDDAAAKRVPGGGGGSAKFWIVRDGQPLRVTDAEYRPGDLPANTREQGRPVTSGDAGRVAEFDTSLSDVGVLKQAIQGVKGATGTKAKVQASMPNWFTELTGGWGADAKSKQAVIDRVKQVIGKALEGGVLRKEDEYKYEKILPTLGDVDSVVDSKIDGLDAAIRERRGTFVDALEDANFDVGKFRARDAARPVAPTAPKVDPLGIR